MEKYFIKAAKSPVSRLEKLAPTDASFAEATAISFDVFPVSEEERRSITEMEECIAQAYKDKKYVECEEMQKKVSVAKAAMHERTRVFELVLQCEKDAAACERMEFANKKFLKAGEWKQVHEQLGERLTAFREGLAQKTQELQEEERAAKRQKSQVGLNKPTPQLHPPIS